MVFSTKGLRIQNNPIVLDQFFNRETLNIFTDGSLCRKGRSYGIVGACGNNIIFEDIREMSDGSINVLELKGIRTALDYMIYYSQFYRYINIFSDSYYAVNMLRRTIFTWRFSKRHNCYITYDNKIVPNQELILGIYRTMYEMIEHNPFINLYWCPAHTDNGTANIMEARERFCKLNGVNAKVDLNFIRYIATMNNMIDNKVQQCSRHYSGRIYTDPISFIPIENKK